MLSALKNWWDKKDARVDLLTDGSDKPSPTLSSDITPFVRAGAGMLLLGLGGFLFWAFTAPLDEGIPANATVSVESKRKTVQHLSGGVIAQLLVREAQTVKAGDPLVRLDQATLQANHDAAEQNFASLAATQARLIAEQSGGEVINFPASITTGHISQVARSHIENQRALFHSRRSALEGDIQVHLESAANFEQQASAYATQLGFLEQELKGVRDLAAEGYIARNRLSEMERQRTELVNNQQRAKQSAIEARSRINQRKQEYRKEIETQLADTRRDLGVAAERLNIVKDELQRAIIRSPADGSVVGLTVHTVGGVVTPGQRLMDVVPTGSALILEAQVLSHLIDRVSVGLLADVSIQAFANQPDLTIEGKVISVSSDLIIDPNPNAPPYYLARVEVTPEGAKKLGTNTLQPGMPASVVIRTGERTFIAYILKPLLRRLNNSLTEQ